MFWLGRVVGLGVGVAAAGSEDGELCGIFAGGRDEDIIRVCGSGALVERVSVSRIRAFTACTAVCTLESGSFAVGATHSWMTTLRSR